QAALDHGLLVADDHARSHRGAWGRRAGGLERGIDWCARHVVSGPRACCRFHVASARSGWDFMSRAMLRCAGHAARPPQRLPSIARLVSEEVVLLRGLDVAPWDLRPYERLGGEYSVKVLVSHGNRYHTSELALAQRRVTALSDLMPPGPLRHLGTRALGQRFLGLASGLRGAAIVHAAELGNWYSAQAARLKERMRFKFVVTAWETLPRRSSHRNIRTRPYARGVLQVCGLFVAATERAREALL